MGIKWSTMQQAVIDSRDENLLVSAAAGSGKTAVLTERIVRTLSDKDHPADITRMLVVTFTRAAAAQMRERIGKRMDELIKEDPGNSLLRHNKLMLSAAKISTIHSLCTELIQENFDVLEIDPSYRMGDESELKILKTDTVSDLLEVYYQSGNAAFRSFMDAYAPGRNIDAISEWILKGYEMSRSCPDPDYWLDLCQTWYTCPADGMENHVMVTYAVKRAGEIFEKDCHLLENVIDICNEANGPAAYLPAMEHALEVFEGLKSRKGFEDIREALKNASFKALSTKRQKDVPDDLKNQVKDINKLVKDDVNKLLKGLFSDSLEGLRGELEFIAPSIKMLTELIREFTIRFQAEKQDRNLMDFSDLEHYALKLLVDFNKDEEGNLSWKPTRIADQLCQYYQQVICDEYQDSNRVQELILEALSGTRAGRYDRFMVGDVKQSIYGFRQADAAIFLEKYNSYPQMQHCARIDLGHNYRSRKSVLDGINAIFGRIMRSEAGGIEYDEAASLKAGAKYPMEGDNVPCHTDIILIDSKVDDDYSGGNIDENGGSGKESKKSGKESKKAGSEDENSGGLPTNIELEAAAIADEILKLTDPATGILVKNENYHSEESSDPGQPEQDGGNKDGHSKESPAYGQLEGNCNNGSMRRAVFGDIVILLRSVKGYADVIANVLVSRGIPAQAELSVGFFSAPEIMTMTSLLSIIDNPRQDIPLCAVLKSPIVGLTSQELALIRSDYSYKDTELYDAVCLCDPDYPFYEKVRSFLSLLERLREASDYMQIDELISYAFELTGYYDIAGAMPAGSRRKANLDMLLEKARAFMACGMTGLFNFMRYLGQMKDNKIDFGEAGINEESGGHVSIVSIHKSKGLEYPIVILACLGKQFNKTDINSSLVMHPKFGIGINAVDPDSRRMMKAKFKSYISSVLEGEMIAEELRVLYVAMTRAKEKLVLMGCVKNAQGQLEKWQKVRMDESGRMAPFAIVSAVNYLDLIMPCIFDMGAAKEIEEDFNLPAVARRENETSDLFRAKCVALQNIIQADVKKTVKDKAAFEKIFADARPDSHMADLLDKDAIWEYKWKDDLHLRGKYSVSELKHMAYEDEESQPMFSAEKEEDYIPIFMREENVVAPESSDYENVNLSEKNKTTLGSDSGEAAGPSQMKDDGETFVTGAMRGTAFHRAMELIDFAHAPESGLEEWVKAQFESMISSGRLDRTSADLAGTRRVAGFLRSSLGRRMADADRKGKLHRESQFVMGVPSEMVNPAIKSQELIIVQGIIDGWFEEEDKIILMDYKTDNVPGKNGRDILIRRYKSQLDYYAYALEKSTGKKVLQKLIYSVKLNEVIEP